MDIVLSQILVIMLYVAIGYLAGWRKLINPEQRRYLTRICTDLIMPFTIISASNQTITPEDMRNLALILVLMLALFALTTALSLWV